MGIQIHAGANYRRVVELVRSGAIGHVSEAHCWVGKAWGGGERPSDTPSVPEGLDWQQWLGARPFRPYHPAYHPAGWRRYWDFGTGTLGDMGCHHLDLPFWALGLGLPEEVHAEGTPVHAETAPTAMRARWGFPARLVAASGGGTTERAPVTLWWHDGGLRPPQFERGELPDWGDGTLFVGDKGMLLADYGRHLLLPEERFRDTVPPPRSIPDSVGHHREWLDACRTRGMTTCGFDYASRLTETVLLGVVAYRIGRGFRWDAERMRAVDCPAADLLLGSERA
jgi:predicted dehydrogenase